LVAYEDGSLSYSPEKTFEEGFSRTNDFFENGALLSIEGHNGVTFITARDVTISAGGIATLQEEIDLEGLRLGNGKYCTLRLFFNQV
ncbi:TPA: hypothetical protein ACHYJE_005354, partial [Escherichia coli]